MPVFAGGDDRDMGPVSSFYSNESVTQKTVIPEELGTAFANTYHLNNHKKSLIIAMSAHSESKQLTNV